MNFQRSPFSASLHEAEFFHSVSKSPSEMQRSTDRRRRLKVAVNLGY